MPPIERFDLIKKSFGSISRALNWITNTFLKKESREKYYCSDIVGTSFVLSSLLNIYKHDFDQFNPKLWESRRSTPLKSVDVFLDWFENHFDFETYIESYLDILLTPSPPFKLLNHDLEKIVWNCRACRYRFECLYVFKEVLSYFDPTAIKDKDSLNYKNFKSLHSDLANVLEKYLIDSKEGSGWAFTIGTKSIDPYVTARILEFFYKWGPTLKEFRFRKDFRVKSKIFDRCLKTVKKLQVTDTLVRKYNVIDSIDVSGAWREIQWGQYEVWRIKGTSDIAKILYTVDPNGSKESIAKVKSFIERTLGRNPYAVDVTIFSDGYTATVSDITGTIAVADFYVSLGHEFDIGPVSEPVLAKIKWLLDQQRTDGAWPVLSEHLWQQEERKKDSEILRKKISNREKMNNNNVSLCNTILMIHLFMEFLKKSLTTT